MFASLHIVDDGLRGTLRARKLKRIASTSAALRHLEYGHTGRGGHVDPGHPRSRPRSTAHSMLRRDSFGGILHPTRRGLFCVWDDQADAQQFSERVAAEGGCGPNGWSLLLRPISSRGRLRGGDPLDDPDRERIHPSGPVVIATCGELPWSRLHRFHHGLVGPLAELPPAPGLERGIALASLGRRMQAMTWTQWSDLPSGLRFAYQSAEHSTRIAGERGDRPIFGDTWFARFEIAN